MDDFDKVEGDLEEDAGAEDLDEEDEDDEDDLGDDWSDEE